MKLHIENVGEYLKSHDIKPSYQRIKIFEYLVEHKNHPTVDMIYKALVDEIPTLSKTTVLIWPAPLQQIHGSYP